MCVILSAKPSLVTAETESPPPTIETAPESATPGVHTAFSQILNDTLCMQNEIYAKMTAKGWYPTQNAEQQKIDAAKQKFSASK